MDKMKHLLLSEYGIQVNHMIDLQGVDGYQSDKCLYFIIPANKREDIYMEQAALSYYLYENGYFQTAIPIQNHSKKWFTTYEYEQYLVVKVENIQSPSVDRHGYFLANLHDICSAYMYEPKEISSYGQWRELWIQKLSVFEHEIIKKAKSKANSYDRYVMDIFPYIIGMSENAIQYIRESESEVRYNNSDQGTITFRRYANQLTHPVIWFHDLAYDHPTRDLAEFIRYELLYSDTFDNIVTFVNDYQQRRPLSIFGIRLLYARLIFPIHLFDSLIRGFIQDSEENLEKLSLLMNKQAHYEEKLSQLFTILQIDYKSLEIPVLHWLGE